MLYKLWKLLVRLRRLGGILYNNQIKRVFNLHIVLSFFRIASRDCKQRIHYKVPNGAIFEGREGTAGERASLLQHSIHFVLLVTRALHVSDYIGRIHTNS